MINAFAKLILHFVSRFNGCSLGTRSNVTTVDKNYSVYCITELAMQCLEVLFGFVFTQGRLA